MATSKDLKAMSATVLEILDLLDAGEVTADELRGRTRELPDGNGDGLLPWIDLAEALHQYPEENETPAAVKNPRFCKGTGMRPAAWSDCLWRPPGS